MRRFIAPLLLLTACATSEPFFVGTWDITDASGRPSELFVSGRTLQLFDDGRAVLSGGGQPDRSVRYEVANDRDRADRQVKVLLFDGEPSPYTIGMPTRTELLLEETGVPATLLKLRRAR